MQERVMAASVEIPTAAPMPAEARLDDKELREATSRLAYELYEQRGRMDGHDVEDWLAAEALAPEALSAGPPAAA
jgi:hypothetical protein